jgi:hypothetical protein
MNKLLILFLFTLLFEKTCISQSKKEALMQKGVIVFLNENELDTQNFQKIIEFDFSQYRNEKSSRFIQILNGPKIELISYSQLEKSKIQIDEKIREDKKNEVVFEGVLPLITLVDIGYTKEFKEILR